MSLLARMAHLSRRCPPAWKVTRAVSEPGRAPEVIEHLEVCVHCSEHYRSHRDVVMRIRALPGSGGLSPESRAAIAATLWRSKAEPRPERDLRWRWILPVVAIPAAVLVLGLAALRRLEPHDRPSPSTARTSPSSLATIHSFGTARFTRAQAAPDEIVRLEEGRISLDITPLLPNQRFRVLTDDAVVEVRGTSFELTVLAGRLVAASVTRGRVEVKAGNALTVLDAGDRWERASPTGERASPTGERASPTGERASPPVAPTTAPRPPAPPPAHTPGRRPLRPVEPRSSTAVERAMFAQAWSSLRAGKPAEAAVAFAELEARAAGSSIEEDAVYWRAVAEARRHDETLAAHLFQDFLKRFPNAGRRGEAATALGWLLLHSNDVAGARRAFEIATSDPSPVVRSSAREGLQRTK